MDNNEEAVTTETTRRRTRSGRCSLPMASKPPARKTRKKMVLVEVEVSDEDENESSQQQASIKDKMQAGKEAAETYTELKSGYDDKQKKSPTKMKHARNFNADEEVKEHSEILNEDLTKFEDKMRGINTADDTLVEIVENDYTIVSTVSENVDYLNSEEVEIESCDLITSNVDPEHEIKTGSVASELEIEESDDRTATVKSSTNDMTDANGIVNDVFHSTTTDVCSPVTHESKKNDVSSNLDDKYEFTEPMDIDEDNLILRDGAFHVLDTNNDTDMNELDAQAKVLSTDRTEFNPDAEDTDADKVITDDDREQFDIKCIPVDMKGMIDSVVPQTVNLSDDTEQNQDEQDQDMASSIKEEFTDSKQILPADPDAENISEDELPTVQVVKVPETEEVSDEELPGPKRAELPADTEVVSEDELPAVKKEGTKRKIAEGDYDPGSPTSENEVSPKKPFLELEAEKEKDKPEKPKKLPELDKYWKAVNDDPTDFTGWTYLLQYVDQENDMEAAREAYDAFLSHYPYCYGYWRKYADYEKRKGNKKKCEEVFERGLKAIPLSVDLWIHYLTYVRTSKPEEEDFVRSQFERALNACGLEFRSDRLWDSYIKWETDAKRLQHATVIYDRLLTTPTQGYTTHFDNFQEHVSNNPPNKILEVDEFLALRKEVKHMLKHDVTTEPADNSDVPPGEDSEEVSSDEETKAIRERIISIRRKIHKNTVTAVTGRWNFEEGIKRPYFHVKPLERCQLKNWQEYLDYEVAQGDQTRIIVLFERCLIACALYEEFWLRFVHYLEGLKDSELHSKIKDVYERACTIHHIKKPNLHLQWAMFEESIKNYTKAAEILVNLEKSVPNILQVAYRRINLERRRDDFEKCTQLYEHYIANAKNKTVSTNLSIKYSRFCLKLLKNYEKAVEILNLALAKDGNNPRLYLQLIDLSIQKEDIKEDEVIGYLDAFLEKENVDVDQKVLFAQRKLEFLEDFGSDIHMVRSAYDEYQKHVKASKEVKKKEPVKGDTSAGKKEKNPPLPSSQTNSYANYGNYGNSSGTVGTYQYSGSQQGQYNYSQYGQNEQYQYGNWQYPQSGYSGYNQWSGYSGGYGY